MRAVLPLSGGLDSCALLWHLKDQGFDVLCVNVDYGQRHEVEMFFAKRIAAMSGSNILTLDLSSLKSIFRGCLAHPSMAVPRGHYQDESMKATVVPNRNMILLSIITAIAASEKREVVSYAAHAGDHAIYPDCRPEFVDAIGRAIGLCDWHSPRLYTPFIHKTKADIVRIGCGLGAPLDQTWSCYEGDQDGSGRHCGACGACVERREAFLLAGVEDATSYRE